MRKNMSWAIVLCAAASFGGSALAASYDGTWEVAGAFQSTRCPAYNMKLMVRGSEVSAISGTVKFTYHLHATIKPDGSFEGVSPGGTARFSGKFEGDNVAVDFANDVCAVPRHGLGKRSG
jgi:hypothetical protein